LHHFSPLSTLGPHRYISLSWAEKENPRIQATKGNSKTRRKNPKITAVSIKDKNINTEMGRETIITGSTRIGRRKNIENAIPN